MNWRIVFARFWESFSSPFFLRDFISINHRERRESEQGVISVKEKQILSKKSQPQVTFSFTKGTIMRWIAFYLSALLPTLTFGAQGHDIIPKLTLSASAVILKPADELQIKIGCLTLALTAEEALDENSGKMRAIISNMEFLGLGKDDYETNQFSVKPTYTPYPQYPPADWRPSINGYEVTNSILIHTRKLDMAGKIIDLANKAGANSITDIRFGLRSSRDYWSEALAAAGAHAVNDARAIAEATGVRLIRVLSISLNHTQVRGPQLNLASFPKASGSEASPPIEAGDVSIEASVSLVYEIE
jgi:uncharacterized protein YggE